MIEKIDTKRIAKQVEESVTNKGDDEIPLQKASIPTGSTLLNLACSDNPFFGYNAGKVVNIVGDSSSGKTLLVLTMLAEMARNSDFDEYELIYDDAEVALEFDIEKLFGVKTAERVQLETKSNKVGEFYSNILKVIAKGKPFVYVLDSLDALSTDQDEEAAKQFAKKGEAEGSFKLEKPSLVSQILRYIIDDIKDLQALVVVLSQTRQNIGVMFGEKKRRSGGDALRFYSTIETWLAVKSKEKYKEREIGSNVIAKVKKNKQTGKLRHVEFTTYYDYGVDDINSCIDFLVSESYWKKVNGKITTAEADKDIFGVHTAVAQSALVEAIEESNLERQLQAITGDVWLAVEKSLKLGRKRRFE